MVLHILLVKGWGVKPKLTRGFQRCSFYVLHLSLRTSEGSLKVHNPEVNKTDITSFACTVCSKFISNQYFLKTHVQTLYGSVSRAR